MTVGWIGSSRFRAKLRTPASGTARDAGRGDAAPPSRGTRQTCRTAPALRIDPRRRSSYDRFLVENRESVFYPLIGGIVSRLRDSGNAPTKDRADFLTRQPTDP
jgi:hypothetical protein